MNVKRIFAEQKENAKTLQGVTNVHVRRVFADHTVPYKIHVCSLICANMVNASPIVNTKLTIPASVKKASMAPPATKLW